MLRAAGAGLLVTMLLASTPAHASPHRGQVPSRAALTTSARSPIAGWQASWDPRTRVPAWLWGATVAAPGATADPAVAERAARAFLAQHLGVLAPGAAASDFTVLANHVDARGLRTVTFAQHWRGMRVVDGAVGFVFGRDRLFAIRSRALPDVSAPLPRSTSGRARSVLRTASGYRVVEIHDERGRAAHEHWDVYRDAITGAELERRTKVMFGSGTLEYNAGVRYGGGPRTTYPAQSASILVNSAAATTGSDGTFTWAGTNPATVVSAVQGTYVRVTNIGGASAMQSFNVASGATAVWDASGSELDDAQVSAYVYANIAKARARIVNPAASAWTDAQTEVKVNDATGSCNAFSTGDGVQFFRGNAQCENTGRVGDVVFHELGHSLHNQSIIAGMGSFDTHLSEGLSDFFASNITGDPAMGRGFFKSEEPLRQIDPPGYERVYPLDFDFDPHVSGLIIGGALWDLRKALIAQLGAQAGIAQAEAIFTGIMQRADDISTTFTAALIADDDDADLGNGTPHYCAIETAFGRHGLVPGLAMTTVAAPVLTGREVRVHVTTPTGTACPPIGVASITLTWKANDGVASEVSLAPTGDDWLGELPEQPDGTLVTYSLDVVYADGTLASFPNNPADPQYQAYFGEVTPLWCEPFDSDPGWEETSNLGREWQWGPLLADPTSPDPDAPYTGTAAFGTDVAADGAYRANLDTTITTPVIAIPTFQTVRLQYWRWLTVEDGAFDQATIAANGTEIWHNASAQNGTLDHVDREWRFHDIDITPWISDGTLRLAWRLDSDFGKELGGWTLDDVCVVGIAKIPTCGDGELDIGEQCDDGNGISDDGCSATCIDEVTAGGGGACAATGNSGSWLATVIGLLGLVMLRRRQPRPRAVRSSWRPYGLSD